MPKEKEQAEIVADSISANCTCSSKGPTGIPGVCLQRVNSAVAYYRHLKRLRRYVNANSNKPFSVADAADYVGVSPCRLARIFKEKTGLRLGDWICYRRIESAKRMLYASDAAVTKIAFAVGFSNSRAFERAFRKMSGCTASEYRRAMVPH